MSSLVLSPAFETDGVVFAGTMEDGVFRSSDRGATWQAWNIGLLDYTIYCLAASPAYRQDQTLYVGTESGIFASANGGRFWKETGFQIDDAPVLSMALSPSFGYDGIIFAGTAGSGLISSGDRGTSWERMPLPDSGGAVNAVLLSPEFPATPHLLVLLDNALLVSRDGGRMWSEWQAGVDFESALITVIAPVGLDPSAPLLVGLVDGRILRIEH